MHLQEGQFYLTVIRHGQTEGNRKGHIQGYTADTPLTELGLQQASTLANHFKSTGIKFDKIYSSDSKRAQDTALIVAAACAEDEACSAIQLDKRLRERCYGSKFEGKAIDIFRKEAYQKGFDEKNYTNYVPEGSESMEEVLSRVDEFCIDTVWPNNERRKEVLLVSHWATIRELLKILQPLSGGAIRNEHLLEMPNTAYSRFLIRNQEFGVNNNNNEEEQITSFDFLIAVQVVCLHQTPHIVNPLDITLSDKHIT